MKQLELFQMAAQAQSLSIAAKANGKQSNPFHSITASIEFPFDIFDDVISAKLPDNDDDKMWGDIYDEYEDFDVCSRVW